MAVTKLPRTRKGTISQGPPLSWPNDTAIGRRRPNLGLLRQATHNRQQRRLSTLPATSKQNVPRPVQHSAVRSQASKASGYPRYKTHKRIHHPAQQPTASRFSGKAPKQNKGLAPHSTQLRKHSKLSRNSLIDEKEDAKSQKDSHITSAKGIDWPAYHRAKAHRLKKIRIWVHALRRSHRIVDPVAKELMAYYGSEEKYGAHHPSASTLSEHAWQAVKLCEHEFGTDLQWGKSLGKAVWGSEHEKVERLIEMKMKGEGEGTPGRGTVGESDLSEFEDEDDDEGGEGFWGEEGKGEGKDVEMADKA